MDTYKCNCFGCVTHNKYKWTIVMECKCSCHELGFTAHDVLCCSIPNALKKECPHTELDNSDFYLKELNLNGYYGE